MTTDTTERLIEKLRATADAHGLAVRCPVCNAGKGRYCLKDMSKLHTSADEIVLHPERVALARQS